MEIKIDYGKCTGCRECVYACNYGVLTILDGAAVVAVPQNCSSCMKCVNVCIAGAVSVK